ncbi:MAG: helix-turn-helix domain-containing protein [Eubacteriales bacterium]
MTFGEKLARLRRENNITQDQLAQLLSVSRQSVSKWESGTAFPETDKLIRLADLFHCSLDYLLRDSQSESPESHSEGSAGVEEQEGKQQAGDEETAPDGGHSGRQGSITLTLTGPGLFRLRERKSQRTVLGMPLWCVGKHARGFIAVGLTARGVISVGLCSTGVLSVGFASLGLISLGLFAAGGLAMGCFSLGVLAFGAICAGVLSCGAISVGAFSVGALSVGRYVAIGDHAWGRIAIGDTRAVGSVASFVGEVEREEVIAEIKNLDVPALLGWARAIILRLL